jgi:Gpi18-like mannosyltransferase
VWDLASQYTLRGVNVYAHHPPYPGGPYAYFPLFLYVELPLQWLAQHTPISFTILGKLPIVAADLGVALLLAGRMRREGMGDRGQAVAAGLFFLNPLVLYNGAFYGRFDSLCVALLLLALLLDERKRRATWRFSLTYGLAVAAKTFPIFVLPMLVRRDRVSALGFSWAARSSSEWSARPISATCTRSARICSTARISWRAGSRGRCCSMTGCRSMPRCT